MAEQDNIRFSAEYGEALNAHDAARLSSYFAEGFRYQGPDTPEPVDGPTYLGNMAAVWAAFPDLTFQTTETIAQGDYLVVNWICTGTHDGPMTNPAGETVPASGRKIAFPGSTTTESKNGKIVRQHAYYDVMGMMAQLGLAPGA